MTVGRYDGIVLAGGRGSRLGGVNKAEIEVGGRRLIDIAVEALADAQTTIAVGAPLPSVRPVRWTREDPPGGGPVAAITAALPLVAAGRVVVVACDLPFLTWTAVSSLVDHDPDAVATIAVDPDGRDQPLLACYALTALRAALPPDPANASMKALLRRLAAIGPVSRLALPGVPAPTIDCDTAQDLSDARESA